MDKIFAIVIILLNIFAISMLFKMLTGTEISFRIKMTIILSLAMLAISYIIYGITSIGISAELKAVSKPLLLFTIFPINIMVMASPVAVLLNKVKSEEIDNKDFSRKIIRMLVVDLMLIIVECIYLKNIQAGIVTKLKS